MTEPFHNSRYSVEHAKRRFRELEGEIAAFFASNPYATIIETNGDATEDAHKVKLIKPMPVALAGIAFDTLNNLRASLDQAGFAVAVAAGRTGKSAKFPFGDTAVEVQSRAGHTAKHIPKQIFDVMAALQPHETGNVLLWGLNKLCNSNKHEVIIPVAMATGTFHIGMLRGRTKRFAWPPVWDGTKNEMELFVSPHGHTLDYDFNIQTFIALGQIKGLARAPALDVINAMTREVEGALMAIEGEARRLRIF